jgi:hypothetical protein
MPWVASSERRRQGHKRWPTRVQTTAPTSGTRVRMRIPTREVILAIDAPPSDASSAVILLLTLMVIGRHYEREDPKTDGHSRTANSSACPLQRSSNPAGYRLQPADDQALPGVGASRRAAGRRTACAGGAAGARISRLSRKDAASKPLLRRALSQPDRSLGQTGGRNGHPPKIA